MSRFSEQLQTLGMVPIRRGCMDRFRASEIVTHVTTKELKMGPIDDLAYYVLNKIVNGWKNRSYFYNSILIIICFLLFIICLSISFFTFRETILSFARG